MALSDTSLPVQCIMQSSDGQKRFRSRKAAARRVGRLAFEWLESRDMLAADAAATDVYVEVPSDVVWDDSYVRDDTTAENPVVVEDPVVIADPAVDAPLPVPPDEPAADQGGDGDPILVVCPGVDLPPLEIPGQDGSDDKADSLLEEYGRFLEWNSTWFDDHGGNAIQPQVITPSRDLPWIELSTPGAANAFDAWYSLTDLDGLPADGSDPISETGPGDDDVSPPVPVEGSGVGTVEAPHVFASRSDIGGFPSRLPVAYSTAGVTQASGRHWSASMPFMGMGGFGGDTSESETVRLAKARRRGR